MARTPRSGRSGATGTREPGAPKGEDERKPGSGPEGLKARLGRFDKASGHGREDPRSLAFALVIEAAELASLFPEAQADPGSKPDIRVVSRIREEIGDVVLGLMRLCTSLGIDPVSAAEMRVLLLDSGRKAETARETGRRPAERARVQDRRGLLHPPGEAPQDEIEVPDESVAESAPPPKPEGKRGGRSRSRKPPKRPPVEETPQEAPLVTPPPPSPQRAEKKAPSRRHHRRGKSPKPPSGEPQPEPGAALVTPPPPQTGNAPAEGAPGPPQPRKASRRHRGRRSGSRHQKEKPQGTQE